MLLLHYNMVERLDSKYSWDKLAEIISDRIEKNLEDKQFNRSKFITWFMLRKKVGLRFDYKLIHRAYVIWKQLHNEEDHFTVIVGKEGSGKTTLGAQLGAWVSPNMGLDDMCYAADQYLHKLSQVAENYEMNRIDNEDKSVQIDEGGIDLFSREAMSANNIKLNKTFMVQRFLNIHTIICIPSYWALDSNVRHHRIKTLIIIHRRGQYQCVTGRGINILNENGAVRKQKPVHLIPIPYGMFWLGQFNKIFPTTIDKDKYEAHKLKHIKSFLDVQKNVKIERSVLKTTEVMQILGITRPTIKKYIDMGKLRAVNIGQKWLINKEDVISLQNGVNP